MENQKHSEFLTRIESRFSYLYGGDTDRCVDRMKMLMGRYGLGREDEAQSKNWSEKDSILITYGDTLQAPDEFPLQTLLDFIEDRFQQSITGVHILPFFPFSSDDGFSVIDYREVREDLGGWYHIKQLAGKYRLMADVVINHVSRQSGWFKDYLNGVAPARDYFIEMDPETDLTEVTRPRSSPLLTKIKSGKTEHNVWTTFSADQVDLDFSNPDVLFEFLDLILFYVSQGISVLRLDAIAYLWKKPGTSCIHLSETHEVVRLIRDMLDALAPHVTIITETNVPHHENIEYFGNGDEAHMIYQFSLPPLLLHALLFGNASYLTEWAEELESPPAGCYYFNFLASHDGVGVRPVEGILTEEELDDLIGAVQKRGGQISRKSNPDGKESIYELNVSYFDALKDEDEANHNYHAERFLCAQTIMLSLQGIPGIYFHSLTATPNHHEGLTTKGYNRAINRRQWDRDELADLLDDSDSLSSKVFHTYIKLLSTRKKHSAFHPEGTQKIFNVNSSVFVLLRTSPEEKQSILSISNVTGRKVKLELDDHNLPLSADQNYQNFIGDDITVEENRVTINPYETLWLEI